MDKDIDYDLSLLNVEQRLKLDKEVDYEKFEVDIEDTKQVSRFQRELQTKIINALKKNMKKGGKHERGGSHNRLVCIADRREKYYNLKVLGDEAKQEYLTGNNTISDPNIFPSRQKRKPKKKPKKKRKVNDNDDEKKEMKDNESDTDDEEIPPIIEIDTDGLNTREKDEFFIYQPPREYGRFSHDYGQEHLQFLSREYMLPRAIIKDPIQKVYKDVPQGTYQEYNSQMFTVSFCCHSRNDVRIQWYINGWNMRIPKTSNFIKIWPEFFTKSQRNKQLLQKIQKDILDKWKLPIKNREYEAYEKDLLRFDHSKQKGKNGQIRSPKSVDK